MMIAISLSFLYSFSYYCISKIMVSSEKNFYVVQVGAFSSKENANQLIEKIQSLDHPIYTYDDNGLEYVVTLVSQNEQEVSQEMDFLEKNQIDHVKREYKIDRKDHTTQTLLSFLKNES